MSSKVVSSDSTNGDFHPSFYEGNHWDYYLPDLPILVPLTLFTVPNSYSWRDPITSPKAFIPSLEFTKLLNLPNFRKGWEN